MDRRKFNSGGPKSGRKKGIGISSEIQKHVNKMLYEMLKDEAIKQKAIKQIKLELDVDNVGYVYIIENNNTYKIGYTKNWNKRKSLYKSHLGNVNLIYLFKGSNAYELEQELHIMYKDQNIGQNEWFDLNDKQLISIISYCSEKTASEIS